MEFKIYLPNNYNKSFLGLKVKTNKKPILEKLLKYFSGFTVFKNQKGYYFNSRNRFYSTWIAWISNTAFARSSFFNNRIFVIVLLFSTNQHYFKKIFT